MKRSPYRNAGVMLAGVISLGAAQAQTVKAPAGPQADTPIPAITDWSSRSVIHGKAKLPEEFARSAKGDAEMARLYRDPRYVAQVLRRIDAEMPQLRSAPLAQAVQAKPMNSTAKCRGRERRHCNDNPPSTQLEGDVVRDWSNVLGGGANGQGGSGIEGVFPAKYTFDITQAPSCANDFVVYPTNAAGATAGSGTLETWIYTFDSAPTDGETFVVGPPGPRQVVLTAHNSNNSGKNFQNNGSRVNNLRDAINRWTSQTGYRATSSGNQVTVISDNLGNIPDDHVTSFLSNVSGPGGVNGTSTPGQPTIIAFNQLYQDTVAPLDGCNGSWNQDGAIKAPNVMWAYNTGTGYVTETSPVLSYYDNGAQVAFLQRSGDTLQLVLLKWAAGGTGTAAAPTALTSSSAAAYQAARSGSSAAMHVITLNGTTNAGSTRTYSSPFVDYAGDTLWVGDGNGRLHKFTGVFQGLPAEVVANGFPSTVAAGMKLSSPVYDTDNVYIGSQSGAGTLGGRLHRIDAANGANRFDSAKLAISNSTGLRESPIVTGFPAATGSVYAFLFNDGTAGDASNCNTAGSNQDSCRTVVRFPLGFAANATPASRAFVGRGNNINSTLYAGAFTDAYYTNGTGSMYIVGGEAVDTFIPRLWRVDLTNGNLTSSTIGPVLASKTCATFPGCGALDANGNPPNPNTAFWNWSPVTMAKRGADEYVYFSMHSHGGQSGCAGACVYQFHLNNLRNGTSEVWELDIASNGSAGIPTNETNGTITVNGVTLAANVHFSTTGDRKADQIALMTAINSQTSFSAGEVGECQLSTGNCIIRITADALTDLGAGVVATSSLGQTTLTNTVNGATGTVQAWGNTVNANAGLKAFGGTGGIVVDNNSGNAGASQIYFSQQNQNSGGNAIQASQTGLQ